MPFNPIDDPVDTIILAGQTSPGIAEIAGASSPRSWEERKGYGYGGAFIVFRGIKLAQFTVTFRLTTEEHFEEWASFSTLLKRPPPVNPGTQGAGIFVSPYGPRPNALDIFHPILADLGVTSVVVLDVLQPKHLGSGEWGYDVKFIEFRQPVFQLSAPGGSEDRPLSRNQRLIQQLSEQNQALAEELES